MCIVTVSGFSETPVEDPSMYSDTSILQMSPNIAESFFVSLYGGTVADMDGYTWTIDNPSVATITTTTTTNIVTLYKDAGEKIISVDLQNPVSENYENQFQWSVLDGDTVSINIIANGNNAVVNPVTAGHG